ncbi:MAG: molecular chaperone DnaJ [Aminipila sp.]
MKYFENINCIEELKRQYFALAKKFHSDITGGSDEDMKALNAEYSEQQKVLKDIHKSVKEDSTEEVYTAKTSTTEAPEDFINIIKFLLDLKGLEVELCGRWIWITGNTKEHKDLLNKMGCKWCNNKKAWSWHYNGDASGYRKKGTNLSTIRNMYGSLSFRTDETLLLG